ncbi:aquaporin AQPAe.a-like isoform X2 [Octopus vulgaris]|uniref:Aquaporin AQPAe.a-like isoform X2 n=1 Tax=Octopus vulgaris TaxID=6645 RepID=A0AA36ARM9_OCTVU|nr:aquaporin AQPAe.a-like isoform X2 [Octopus vulgaris]
MTMSVLVIERIVPETCRQDLGVTQVHRHLTKGQACGIELILTFILIFTIFATIDPNRKELGSKPLAIGLTISMCHLVGYRYTSSSLNPARSLGPAFVTNRWNSHWIYWVGPFGGGITAGLLYEYIFDPSRRRKPPQAPPSVDIEEDNLGELAAMTPKRETSHFYPVNGPRRSGHGFVPAVPIDSGLENQAYSYEGHSRRYMPQRFTTRREPSEEILLNDVVKPTSDNFFNRPVSTVL